MTKNNMKSLIVKNENRNPNNKDSIAYRLNYIIRKRRYTANKHCHIKPIYKWQKRTKHFIR